MQQSKNGIIAWSLRCSQNKKNSPQNVENFIFHAVKNVEWITDLRLSVLINQFVAPIFCLCFASTGINFRGMLHHVYDVAYDKNMCGPIRTRKCRSTNWLSNYTDLSYFFRSYLLNIQLLDWNFIFSLNKPKFKWKANLHTKNWRNWAWTIKKEEQLSG